MTSTTITFFLQHHICGFQRYTFSFVSPPESNAQVQGGRAWLDWHGGHRPSKETPLVWKGLGDGTVAQAPCYLP